MTTTAALSTMQSDVALDVAASMPREQEVGRDMESNRLTHADGTPDFDVLVQPIALKDYSELEQ